MPEVQEAPVKIVPLPDGMEVRVHGEYEHMISFGKIVSYDAKTQRYEVKMRGGDVAWEPYGKVRKHGYYPTSKNPDDIELPMTFCWGTVKAVPHRLQLTHPMPTFKDGKSVITDLVAEVLFTPYLSVDKDSSSGSLDGKGIAQALMDHKHFTGRRARIRDVTRGDDQDPRYHEKQKHRKLKAEAAAEKAERAELEARLYQQETELAAMKKETAVNIKRAEKAKDELKALQAKSYICPFPGCTQKPFTKGPPGPRLAAFRNHVKRCEHGPKSDAERTKLREEAEGWQLPKDVIVGDPDLDKVPFGKLPPRQEE